MVSTLEPGRLREIGIFCRFCFRLQFCLISVWKKCHLLDFLPRKTLGVSGSGPSESEDNTFSSESVLSLLDINRRTFTKVLLFRSDVKIITDTWPHQQQYLIGTSTQLLLGVLSNWDCRNSAKLTFKIFNSILYFWISFYFASFASDKSHLCQAGSFVSISEDIYIDNNVPLWSLKFYGLPLAHTCKTMAQL